MHIRRFIAEKAAHVAKVRRPVLFFIITMAAALALWLFVAAHYENDARDYVSRDLVTINAYKTTQIADWIGRHQREAERLSRHPFLGGIITEELSRPGSRRAQLNAWLNDHATQERYIAMAFITPRGAVITATPGYIAETKSYFSSLFAQSVRTGAPLLTDLYLGSRGHPRLAMLSPITAEGRGGRTLCVLVIKIDPEAEFYPLVKASPLLFTKAETLLVRKEGDSVLYLNNLNYKQNSALKFRLPLSAPNLPAAMSLKGKTGFFAGTDYRGVKVFSALNSVEGSGWDVVTKVDQATILAPVKTKKTLALVLIGLAALLLYGGIYALTIIRERAAREALKKAEAGLRVSEQIFREFMEHSPVYVFFKDENIRALHLSRNYEAMLGKPLGELLGKSMDELFPSELAKKMVADDKRTLNEGREVVIEEEFNGRSYRTIKFPITIEGKPPYLAGYTIDVTEQKQAEERIKHLNERFTLAANSGHLGIWDWDVPANRLTWDERMYGLYGIKREDFNGAYEAWIKGLHPEDRALCDEAIRLALAGTKDYDIEFRTIWPDGTLRHIKANGEVFRDSGGKPLRMVGVNLDITERKLAENALRESEYMLNEAQKLARLGSYLLDIPSGSWTSSQALEDIFGITSAYEHSVEGWTDLIHPADRAMMTEYFSAEVAGKGRPFDKEYRIIRQDNKKERWVHGLGRLDLNAQGRPVKMHGTIQDITARKLTEELVIEEKERAESYLEIIGVIMLALDKDQSISLINRKGCEMLGHTHEELLGRNWFDMAIPEEQREMVKEVFNKVISGSLAPVEHFENDVVTKSGAHRTIAWTNSVRKDADGNIIGLLTSGEDVTDRNLAERELRETEERLRSLMNSMPDIVCFKDGEGRWLEANSFDLKLFHLEGVEYKGKKDSELAPFSVFYHDAFMACQASDEKAWVNAGLTRGEEVIPRPDGSAYTFDIIKVPLFTPEGKRKALTVVGRDITERKRAEIQLEKLNRDLVEKNQEMENFLYITTHDLRSPLVNIQGFSQNLERYVQELREALAPAHLPAEAKAGLEKLTGDRIPGALKFVLESSRKMDALITALLKVSRLGRVEMKPAAVDMNALLKNIQASLAYQLKQAGGTINCAVLPPCKADPGAVSQLFTNLLDNAIKYRDESRALMVNVSGEVKDGSVFYTVADNGPGIPEADLQRIWNVFYQPERAHAKKGEGIGLPMVKRLTEKNGGSIKVESKEGQGSVFYLELPTAGGT